MTDRPSWDLTWMTLAHGIAQRSLCTRDKVGAVIVSADNTPLMASYNGPPAGFPHNDMPCTEWCPRARGDGGSTWTYAPQDHSLPPHEIKYVNDQSFWRLTNFKPFEHSPWYPLDDEARVNLGYVKKENLDPNYEDCPALHAEANAISRSNHMYRKDGTIYVTSDVCHACAKLIANSGIQRVVVDQTVPREYRNSAKSYEFLTIACGLIVTLVSEHHDLPADYWETAQ